MKKFSFRSIIVLTLIIVIGIISSSSFYIYHYYLKKIIYTESEGNIVLALDLVKDQFYFCIDEHDGKIMKSLLQKMNEREKILNSYMYNAEGKLKFSLNGDTVQNITDFWEKLSLSKEEISLESFPQAKKPFSRAYLHIHNSPSCYRCHSPEQKNLGYVVIDVAMNQTTENIAFIRLASSLVMVPFLGDKLSNELHVYYNQVRSNG